ncbi:hypothetical protein [Arthrobacter sp. N1]|uniref:hypothetical protein n=1 Tax=Arthrobacter sp. N1 TaxID=619291 RepID=UPI003BAECC70
MEPRWDRRDALRAALELLQVGIEDIWVSYLALAGSASIKDLQEWMGGRDELPELQVDLLMLAIDDFAEQHASQLWCRTDSV